MALGGVNSAGILRREQVDQFMVSSLAVWAASPCRHPLFVRRGKEERMSEDREVRLKYESVRKLVVAALAVGKDRDFVNLSDDDRETHINHLVDEAKALAIELAEATEGRAEDLFAGYL